MGDIAPVSEFNQRFKGRMEHLLLHREGTHVEVKELLMEMVKYIGGKTAMPQDAREDIYHSTWIFALDLLPRAANTHNPAAWYRTSINRELRRLALDERDMRLRSFNVTSNHVRSTRAEFQSSKGVKGMRTIPEPIDRCRVARESRRAKPLEGSVKKPLRRFFDDRIRKAIVALADADTERMRLVSYGMLNGLQECRMYALKSYKPCETAMVKFTKDQRLPKGE